MNRSQPSDSTCGERYMWVGRNILQVSSHQQVNKIVIYFVVVVEIDFFVTVILTRFSCNCAFNMQGIVSPFMFCI